MRAWMALLAVIPACGFHSSPGNGSDDGGTDASARCFGSFVPVCFTTPADVPKMPVTFDADGEIDTDASPLCNQRNDQMGSYCVVAGAGLTLPDGKTLRAYGNNPLILLSTTSFDLSGTIDVSSTSRTTVLHPTGAGVVALASCTNGTLPAEGNSGGFGGSFGGKGGNGQQQDTGNRPTAGPPVSFPSELRGGCPGSSGSSTPAGMMPGTGGNGGGAVDIIATEIHINNGRINASGAAGTGGSANTSGGGGGGSGGMIVLDSPSIIPSGTYALFANGGGGGQGGAGPGANPGAGQNGSESMGPTMVGIGGTNGTTAGGAGGNGAFGTISKDAVDASTGSLSTNAGGGAGGGGAGFTRAPGVTMNIAPLSTDP